MRPYRGTFALALALLLASFGVELLGPWLIRRAIDGPITSAALGRPVDRARVVLLGAVFLANTAFGAFLAWTFAIRTAVAGQAIVRDVRDRLFAHLLALDVRHHDRHAVGQLVTRVTTDVENLSQAVTTGALQTLFDVLKLSGIVVALFFVDPWIAAWVALALPAGLIASVAFRGRARAAYRTVRAALARQNGFAAELIGGVRITRAFGSEAVVDARYAERNRATRDGWFGAVRAFAAFFATVDVVVRWSQAGLLFFGGRRVLAGSLSAGALVQGWFYFQKLAQPIRELGEKFHVLQAALASAERIFALLDEPAGPPASPAPVATVHGRPARLRLRGVRFGYDPARAVLEDVDLDVAPGTTCAVVGPTGAGKSTLLGLCARLVDPDAGTVELDGVPLTRLDERDLRRRVAAVPQEPFLFAGTLRDNVRLFDPEIPDAAVHAALRAVDASAVVERLGGLDATLGERGARLSLGERQLVALARAVLADPDLLLLDEATASIDSVTEARLLRALRAAMAGRTVIVVAHRLSTVRDADQIVVVEHGRIVERGRHAELVARGGRYARMVQGIA